MRQARFYALDYPSSIGVAQYCDAVNVKAMPSGLRATPAGDANAGRLSAEIRNVLGCPAGAICQCPETR
jgi:hypothetical protein